MSETESNAKHPNALCPLTIYFTELVGVATGFAQVVQLNPVDGVQVYWEAPLADNCAVLPRQTFISLLTTTAGVGCTVMVNDLAEPGQRLVDGVTVIVAVIAVLPVFTAVNAGMFPVPLAGNPIEGSLFVQV